MPLEEGRKEPHKARGRAQGAGEKTGGLRDGFTLVCLTQGKGARVPYPWPWYVGSPCQKETGSSEGRGVTQSVFGSSGF